jgi:hypothetical protein
MELPYNLATMSADQLRELTASLLQTVRQKDQELQFRQLKIDQLTHEMAILRRWRSARRSEQLDAKQMSLLEESIDADLEAIGLELKELQSSSRPAAAPKEKPR